MSVIMSCRSSATPSAVFCDPEVSSGNVASRFVFPVAALTENSIKSSTATAPVAIPGAKVSHIRSQRHTNFTPPRSYIGSIAKNMVRSKSAGSLSTAVSFLVAERVHHNQSHLQGIVAHQVSTVAVNCIVLGHITSVQ